MGSYRIVIEAVGGHGEQREVEDGGTLDLNALPSQAPESAAREAVLRLQQSGATVSKATIEHWPADLTGNDDGGPVDDLLTGKRTGSF